MADGDELLDLIVRSGEEMIRLNHTSSELHQDDVQRVVGSLVTVHDTFRSGDEALLRLLENPTLKT